MPQHDIGISPEQIAHFCRRYHVRKFMLFGSVLREDFRPDSLDILWKIITADLPPLIAALENAGASSEG